jgi:acyl carrier protein
MANRDEELLALLSRAAFEVAGRRLDGFDMDTSLARSGIDSVGVLEMIGYLEDELGLRFPDDEIARLSTVRDVSKLIERTRRAAEPAG